MSLIKEFRDFAVKGNAVDMAVGVIIGGAFGKIVTSIVNDLIMPPIGWLCGGMNFKDLAIKLGEQVGEDGKMVLKSNIYDIIGDFEVSMISSDVLGKAFEPEQRYENPDGTDIIFNTDYFGNSRGMEIVYIHGERYAPIP